MTLVAARPAADRHAPVPADTRIAGLLTDLHALGLHGRTVTYQVAGEPDVRLEVGQDGSAVTAELLWTDRDDAAPEHLQAVRICPDDRRVWQSACTGWSAADAVRFLSDLLLLRPAALDRRYLPLG